MDTQTKAAALRDHFEQIASDFHGEGQTALSDQVAEAVKDMPEESMALLYDIFKAAIGHAAWVEWAGGVQPVGDLDRVEYVMRDGTSGGPDQAGELDWSHDPSKCAKDCQIIRYRITSEFGG